MKKAFYVTKTKECRGKKKKKMFVSSSLRTPDPCFLFESPRPHLLLGDPQLPISLPRNWLSQFFLELFLHSSPVAYWAPTRLKYSSFSVISFCLFILFMGFSRQESQSDLPFPSPVDHLATQQLFRVAVWWSIQTLGGGIIQCRSGPESDNTEIKLGCYGSGHFWICPC